MEELVQAYLDTQGKIADYRNEIKELRKEEKIIVGHLVDAMERSNTTSIKVAEDRFIVLNEKPVRKRCKQKFIEDAEMEGLDKETVTRLMEMAKGEITGTTQVVKLQKKTPEP
ncbi:hypothetical protein [Singapore grouper iridovirus]|uniref:Uncharacterized protein n=1 Tax=Singapore grouper iridovirus TaxID=262968 RepID=Q5YFD0_9VIRU|nr:hypothetical protein ORF135L [Singapore grouper iridovirus]AAS18150.1 unknown [Singapore grouper iridovirus]WAU86844.1 hypothetical protein ORF135L [Singapore grouper iridovirus]WRW24690.1 hypothetical protein [Singapore grouper iridovirus]